MGITSKGVILGLASILFCGTFLLADQRIELGFRSGFIRSKANLPQVHDELTYGPVTHTSFGFFLSTFLFSSRLGIQPEINYHVLGIKTLEQDLGQTITSRYEVSYLSIPLLLVFRVTQSTKIEPRVSLGPYLGLPLKTKEIQTAFGIRETRDLGDNLKNPDAGIIIGLESVYKIRKIIISMEARFRFGLLNISKNIRDVSYDFSATDAFRNRSLAFSIGIAFNAVRSKSPR